MTLILESWEFDPRLNVRDARGMLIVEDDQSGLGDGASVVLDAVEGQEYSVAAASADPEGLGAFRLAVEAGDRRDKASLSSPAANRDWCREALKRDLTPSRKLQVLMRLSVCLYLLKENEAAIEALESAIELGRKLERSKNEAWMTAFLGGCHERLYRWSEALGHYQRALELYEEKGNAKKQAILHGVLGITYKQLYRPAEAIEHFQRALTLEKTAGNKPQVAILLRDIGNVYLDLDQCDRAIEHYERALEIFQELENVAAQGGVFSNLGLAYHHLRRWKEAIRNFEEALDLAGRAGDRELRGAALGNLAQTYEQTGRFSKARDLYLEALGIHEEPGRLESQASVLSGLGGALAGLGRIEEAIESFEKALAIHRKTGNKRKEAYTLGGMGNFYQGIARPEKAIECTEAALEIFRAHGDQVGEAKALGNLGVTYLTLGDPRKAIGLEEESLELARKLGHSPAQASSLANLGGAYLLLGDWEKAERCMEEAVRIDKKNGYVTGEAIQYANLGLLKMHRGKLEKGLELLLRAFTLKDALQGDHFCTLLQNLAESYRLLGRFDESLRHAKKALDSLNETSAHQTEARTYVTLARTLAAQGRTKPALEAFRRAHRLTMRMLGRVEAGLEESLISAFTTHEGRHALDDHLKLLLTPATGASSEQDEGRRLLEALRLVEDLRARAFVQALRAGEHRDLLSPEGKRSWAQIQALRKLMAELARPDRGEALSEENAALVKELEGEIHALERKLKAGEPKYAEVFGSAQEVDLEALGKVLGPKEILIHYTVLDDALTVLLWQHGGTLEARTLELGRKKLEAEVRSALEDITAGRPLPGLKARLRNLRRLLLEGFEERLDGIEGLLVVPDGILFMLPFESLFLEDGRFLVERWGVRYGPSIRVLAELEGKSPASSQYQIVLYGDPAFGGGLEVTGTASVPTVIRGEEPIPPLPHAGREAESISALFPRRLVRLREDATEARFKLECGQGTILHVATHGRFSAGTRTALTGIGAPLYNSWLAFRGCLSDGDGKEDGFLTGAEVLGLDLRGVDLAVLSACQSAAGSLSSHEGKSGLERAFFVAGARAFVGSLWSVEDASTAKFMVAFYGHLGAGTPKAEALRLAKLEFIGARDWKVLSGERRSPERGLARRSQGPCHPFFWAPFVLSGDGRGGVPGLGGSQTPRASIRGSDPDKQGSP
ncbi:MAG: tetratricopeptide repeat protein [Planctomycetes bacterium]|nr:tetratricopeptide repeat protein [Planctomycetota bacterium]